MLMRIAHYAETMLKRARLQACRKPRIMKSALAAAGAVLRCLKSCLS